ncbi:MAG: InlB B-repeat-containing protein, partial [Acutalibacteraceae bacterium]|nr:InlB B-repeat-containing protein [Acutalibacteraceae bacterium]
QPVYADLILYAKCDPDVNVTFNVQGQGYATDKQTMPYGGTAAQPKDPYAEGYSFSGWYTDPECTIEYDFSIPVTADITLYALWLADPIVTFDVQGHGTAPEAQQIKYGDTATEPAEPSAEGYSFAGWYTDPECTNEYDFSIPLTEDITLYALWLADPIVTFDVQGHGTAPEAQQIKYGDTATEPAEPSAEGYSFAGWFTDSECTSEYDFSTPLTEDITLYARWLADVAVTFDVQGHGTAPETQKIKNGDTATEPSEPSAEGYTFRGWYTDAACTAEYDFSDPVTADITLYARWLVNVKGLKLHADGTKKDGTYYILNTDVLEPVFEKDTEEAAIELGHLCTDSSCSNVITELPEKGTTYFFTVYMKDVSSYEKGIQRIMFLPEIANNIDASAEDAVIEFDGLVSSESGDAVTLLFKYTENEIIYTISKGADASWTKGTSTGVDYTVNRNINDSKTYGLFESIEVDGKTVDASQYNAVSGSLNASFKAAYLETLSKGVHTVTFRFKDGSAATKITIKKKTSVKTNSTEKTKSSGRKTPNTGDSNHTELWIGLLFLSLIILIRMTTCRKRDLNT